MNNKKLGTAWEQEVCELMAQRGFWVHFIVPDARGAQPFDVIAVKDDHALAIDCKTCVANSFDINRLEDNQISSFEKWIQCGNEMPMIAVKHKGRLYWIPYTLLKDKRSIKFSNLEYDPYYEEVL